MKEFSLTEFAAFLPSLVLEVEHANHAALEKAAVMVETEAKSSLGTYQEGWPQLAESTQAQRVAQGFPANEPGLRTGEMRDSIKHTVAEKEAYVGSDDDHLLWFELGTVKQPPRTVLAGAAMRKGHEIADVVGRAVTAALAGGDVK